MFHLPKNQFKKFDNKVWLSSPTMHESVVKAIRVINDKSQISVEEISPVPNDLKQEWVIEHIEKYGTTPNIFDGC